MNRWKFALPSAAMAFLIACGAQPSQISSPAPTTVQPTVVPTTVPDVLSENQEPHVDLATETPVEVLPEITLNGSTISTNSDAVRIDGTIATITKAGAYRVRGSLEDGQILVDTKDKDAVQITLDGVTIHNSQGSPLAVWDAEQVLLVLAEGSENQLSDTPNYVFAPGEDEPNATLFSKADLSISGTGSLSIEANYNDGIGAKDGLVIHNGNFTINAVDDAIRGKDYIKIEDGTFAIVAGGDALKSDNDEDPERGYIAIENGSFTIEAGSDGLSAETDVAIANGSFQITAGGGSGQFVGDTSLKAIKAAVSITIDNGEFVLNSADDALHSNERITINGGSFDISTGDDAIHADTELTINDGRIAINESYEAIESITININGGEIHAKSRDDALNAAGGDAGAARPRPGRGGEFYLNINGGYIVLNSEGDGIDSNGFVTMTNGTVIVNGPVQRMNSALDYDGEFVISGGTLVALGSSGMAQAPGNKSGQNSVMVVFETTQAAGSLVNIQTRNGESLMTFEAQKDFSAVVYSSPNLAHGDYAFYIGGSAQGSQQDGLYLDGSYTPGTKHADFTVNSPVTTIGNVRRMW
jgi:hypothetical protein